MPAPVPWIGDLGNRGLGLDKFISGAESRNSEFLSETKVSV